MTQIKNLVKQPQNKQSQKVLQDFTDRILNIVNKVVNNFEQIQQYELDIDIQSNYQSQIDNKHQIVFQIIQKIFDKLIQIIKQTISKNIDLKDYELLERALQKSQEQNRNHISAQHHMRLCNSTLQQKNQELMKQIQSLKENNKKFQEKIEQYSIQCVKMRRKVQFFQDKLPADYKRNTDLSEQRSNQNVKSKHNNSLNFNKRSIDRSESRQYSINRGTISKSKVNKQQKASLILNFQRVFINNSSQNERESQDKMKNIKRAQSSIQKDHSINYMELKKSMQLNSSIKKRMKYSKMQTQVQNRGGRYNSIIY